MWEWIKDRSVPAGWAVAFCISFVGAYLWVYSEFVTAAKLEESLGTIERRILTEKQQQLDAEILKIEVKCQAYPKRCDAVDRALLDRYRNDLQRVRQDLKRPAAK